MGQEKQMLYQINLKDFINIFDRGIEMEIKIEENEKPVEIISCFVECPKCGKTGDYWKTNRNTEVGKTKQISCLYCEFKFVVIRIGIGLIHYRIS